MASASLKTRSITTRNGQRCDHRIEARPMLMRSLLVGVYPSAPPGGSSWPGPRTGICLSYLSKAPRMAVSSVVVVQLDLAHRVEVEVGSTTRLRRDSQMVATTMPAWAGTGRSIDIKTSPACSKSTTSPSRRCGSRRPSAIMASIAG
jgi:hypothetical protein